MALYRIDDFFTSGSDNFTSRAGLFPVHNHQWVSQHNNRIGALGNGPSTDLVYNILAGGSYLWVNQNQLYSGATDIGDSSAQFTITVDQNDSSNITIGSKYFADPKIVAADFSGDWPSLIITSPETSSNSVVTVFQLSGTGASQTISVTRPFSEAAGAVYYWDINSDDFSVVLSSDPSGIFAFNEL